MAKVLDSQEQETLYAAAFGLYEQGDYEKAAGFFTHLIFQTPFERRFWKGLAATRQMQKEYKAALHAWGILCFLIPEDPLPHFHAAECLLSMGEVSEALKALNCAEKLPHAPIERIELIKERFAHV